ncbi:MAG: hypothetical protein AB7S56_00210 [Halothiobacillaceae bacterium]
MLRKNLGASYSPLYFLAALGAGGLSVSFFIYLLFMTPHPGSPMATFNHLWPLLTGDNLLVSALIALDLAVIVFFAFLHFRLLAWNLREYAAFKKTEAFPKMMKSNAEISLMTIPLTLAMSINVMFVLGAVFVPNLWSVVEWMFPAALLAFLAVGVYAMRILVAYFARVLSEGGLDFASSNSLAPMIAIFALAMIAVGLAAPAAMSTEKTTVAFSIALSLFFFATASLLAVTKLVTGFNAMMEHGISEAASPSLWILIPILTLLGITWIRLNHGLHQGFGAHGDASSLFVMTTAVLSVQVLFGLIGWAVMNRLGYFRDYVRGDKGDAGTFALICPGVAFFVFGVFFVNFGLVGSGLLEAFSWVYFLLLLPFVAVQLKTVQLILGLNGKLLKAA